MTRTSASVRLSLALAFGYAAWAPAQNVSPKPPARPAAAAYQLQVIPTRMTGGSASLEIEPDRWIARGFDLKGLLAQVYDFDPRRIEFADPSLAETRYDITLTTPAEMDTDALQGLAIEALTKKLGLNIAHESRDLDVYVLTAPGGPTASMHRHVEGKKSGAEGDDAEQFKFEERHCTGIASSHGITAKGGTMRDFGRELEPDLDRMLIDETHMANGYDFNLGGYGEQETLFKLLHDELGLVVVAARRNVDLVVIRAAGNEQARP